ncbi:MAG: DNA mismatch endonuclease Vsr [Candidatus Competibacteraceae bacterium]|nr:DNA mismatch endonuclease Vsr [Candidatus Competibacteraceae bacterium]
MWRKRDVAGKVDVPNPAKVEDGTVAHYLVDLAIKVGTAVGTDTLTPSARSERMGRIRNRDTGPEMRVRRLAHGMGYRYRLYRADLPGKPDLVFPSRRKIIFVHGCFWHRHPDAGCTLARLPKSRLDFWRPKLEGNRARDLENQKKLIENGWRVLVVWECELRDAGRLERTLRGFLDDES